MTEFIIRVVILFAIVFGVSYGITRTLKTKKEQKLLGAKKEAKERLEALGRALDAGEMDRGEYDRHTRALYSDCRDKGIDLDDL